MHPQLLGPAASRRLECIAILPLSQARCWRLTCAAAARAGGWKGQRPRWCRATVSMGLVEQLGCTWHAFSLAIDPTLCRRRASCTSAAGVRGDGVHRCHRLRPAGTPSRDGQSQQGAPCLQSSLTCASRLLPSELLLQHRPFHCPLPCRWWWHWTRQQCRCLRVLRSARQAATSAPCIQRTLVPRLWCRAAPPALHPPLLRCWLTRRLVSRNVVPSWGGRNEQHILQLAVWLHPVTKVALPPLLPHSRRPAGRRAAGHCRALRRGAAASRLPACSSCGPCGRASCS